LVKKNNLATVFVVSFVSQYSTGLGIYLLGVYFGLPGIEGLRKFVFVPTPILIGGFLLMGGVGYLGLVLYKKFENTSLVKRIQQ
jgi:spore maturation protein SpmB